MNTTPRLVDQRKRYSLIRNALPPPPSMICEFGVGGGWLIRSLHDEGFDVRGCDVALQENASLLPLAGRILAVSGASVPFPDNHFDAVYSCDVLEHVQPHDRERFLSEMVRVTKPGGVVALTAFFKNTKSFRLWGSGHLFLKGYLPGWFLEHLTIPLPQRDETLAFFSSRLRDVRTEQYQRSLNLLVMWLQSVLPDNPVVNALLSPAVFVSQKCDCFGRPTSCFFVGRK